MPAYVNFARFYDQIMGDRANDVERIRSYIKTYLPSATSLLELGCGTGSMLAGLSADLEVTGVDASPQMLEIAATKVGDARLLHADMTQFSLGARFDVVICVFDSLNHLSRFELWIELFKRVEEHLKPGGLFVFDVNTMGRLRALGYRPPFVLEFDGNTLIMNVTPAAQLDTPTATPDAQADPPPPTPQVDDGVWIWETRIFEHLEGDNFRLHREAIPELGVPLARIRAALAPTFELLEETDLDGGQVSDESDRVFFAYRRRLALRPQQRVVGNQLAALAQKFVERRGLREVAPAVVAARFALRADCAKQLLADRADALKPGSACRLSSASRIVTQRGV